MKFLKLSRSWSAHIFPKNSLHYREYAKTRDKKWSIKIKSQKQRCRQVQRSDILPMIQWVAVHRYLEENEKQDGEYDQQEAKEMFEQMAEEALQKCDMAPLNPR